MKATTCVRVVLPTDELVRMECPATMTVADLVRVLEKRSSFQKANEMEKNGGEIYFSRGDNNCDPNPATELGLGYHSNGSMSKFCRGMLSLVRMESELKAGLLVVDQVEELDILEFQIASLESTEWIPEINGRQSNRRISPIMRSSPHKMVEAVQPVSTALIPLWQVNQDRRALEEAAARQHCAKTAEPQTPAEFEWHSEVRLKKLIEHSNVRRSVLRRRGARRHPTLQNKRRGLLFTSFQERRHYAKMRKCSEYILLQAGMQMIERFEILQKNVRELVFLLRDAVLGGNALRTDDLLTLARIMVNALTRTDTESNSAAFPVSEDSRESVVRRLSRDIAGKDGGAAILLEGWVVTAEWGTFWRTQRREYACLCDNHMLYFFSSRTRCADFVFEIGRERDGTVSEASKCFQKDNSPLSQIDLSETDLTVRKSIQYEDSGSRHRNAFAFFDSNGRMRLVLDVSTAAEATMWARMISTEISQNKLFARMRELNGGAPALIESEMSEDCTYWSNPLTVWMEILTHSSTTMSNQNTLIIPLRTLHAQIDRLNGTARAERYKSWTLSQALKDLQRDRVKINGSVLADASLETNILALTLEALRCTGVKRANITTRSTSGDRVSSVSTAAQEMTALQFARQVIIRSSRTHGGGDIFDTLHLLFGNDKFCICPDARSMQPIEINISQATSTEASLNAHITMKMVYRVIPTDSIGTMLDQSATEGSVTSCLLNGRTVLPAEFKIQGTYSQRLNYHFIEANDIEGSVQLQFAG